MCRKKRCRLFKIINGQNEKVFGPYDCQTTQEFTYSNLVDKLGSGRAFCSEIGSFCLKNKSGIFVNGIIYDNETKERTFLFLLVLM